MYELDEITCYDWYEVDTADIWHYESELFKYNKINSNLARKIIDVIQHIIIQDNRPIFKEAEYVGTDYYDRNYKQYAESLDSLEKQYWLNYFFCRGDCYQYDRNIFIGRIHRDYEFLFTLKLRQYDGKISSIEPFLKFHLKKNFNDQKGKFITFLNFCIKQYRELLSDKVVTTTKEWIRQNEKKHETKASKIGKENDLKRKQINLSGEEKTLKFNSFLLRSYKANKEYFSYAKVDDQAWKVYQALKKKENNFFHFDTKWKQFTDILSNKKIKPENRIDWVGSFKELNLFVKLLNSDLQKIEPIKTGIWDITIQCFTKDGKDILKKQVHKPNGKDDNYEILKKILEPL